MAVSKTITYKNITIENAYIKAEGFTGYKNGLTFYMRAYKDKDSSNSTDNILTSDEITFVPDDSENALRWDKQAYEYVKSLDEYSDVVDC